LPGDRTRTLYYVEPAVSKGHPPEGGEAVVTIHVSEPTDPLVSSSTVEFDQHGVLVVANIAQIAQAMPALLPGPLRQAMWPLDCSQVRHFEHRLSTQRYIVDENRNQPAVPLTRTCLHRLR
jgi:hypothetical protein